jgi:hypothetical protein
VQLRKVTSRSRSSSPLTSSAAGCVTLRGALSLKPQRSRPQKLFTLLHSPFAHNSVSPLSTLLFSVHISTAAASDLMNVKLRATKKGSPLPTKTGAAVSVASPLDLKAVLEMRGRLRKVHIHRTQDPSPHAGTKLRNMSTSAQPHSLATGHHRSIARWHPDPQQEELSRLWRRLDGNL